MNRSILISPHNDDAALFGAFTVMRELCEVVVVYDSYLQANRGHDVTAADRQREDRDAMSILGCHNVRFLGVRDDTGSAADVFRALGELGEVERVWAPAFELEGHPQHNLVARISEVLWPHRTAYLTYTLEPCQKSTAGLEVVPDPAWIPRKLRALACYESQMLPELGCWPHFLREQREYYQQHA